MFALKSIWSENPLIKNLFSSTVLSCFMLPHFYEGSFFGKSDIFLKISADLVPHYLLSPRHVWTGFKSKLEQQDALKTPSHRDFKVLLRWWTKQRTTQSPTLVLWCVCCSFYGDWADLLILGDIFYKRAKLLSTCVSLWMWLTCRSIGLKSNKTSKDFIKNSQILFSEGGKQFLFLISHDE